MADRPIARIPCVCPRPRIRSPLSCCSAELRAKHEAQIAENGKMLADLKAELSLTASQKGRIDTLESELSGYQTRLEEREVRIGNLATEVDALKSERQEWLKQKASLMSTRNLAMSRADQQTRTIELQDEELHRLSHRIAGSGDGVGARGGGERGSSGARAGTPTSRSKSNSLDSSLALSIEDELQRQRQQSKEISPEKFESDRLSLERNLQTYYAPAGGEGGGGGEGRKGKAPPPPPKRLLDSLAVTQSHKERTFKSLDAQMAAAGGRGGGGGGEGSRASQPPPPPPPSSSPLPVDASGMITNVNYFFQPSQSDTPKAGATGRGGVGVDGGEEEGEGEGGMETFQSPSKKMYDKLKALKAQRQEALQRAQKSLRRLSATPIPKAV